jgi:hypothetical protein
LDTIEEKLKLQLKLEDLERRINVIESRLGPQGINNGLVLKEKVAQTF